MHPFAAQANSTPTPLASDIVHNLGQVGVRLQCPRCRTDIAGRDCLLCGFQMRTCGGIVDALPMERAAHYARFIEDYEHIRAAEGRGSEEEKFYLELPYRDLSGRNSGQWQIRARSYDCLLERVLTPRFPTGGGRILDLGAGNCWMSFRLAISGHHPLAVDLLANNFDGLGAAEHYRGRLPGLFPRFRAEHTHLPFQSGQFDVAIFNASFHYAEDYETTLREALRCVRHGGLVVVCDTPWYASEKSGQQMVAERHAAFLQRYGTASESVRSREYLTDERLRSLEERLSIRWTAYSPRYGFRWALRPFAAKLRNRREPSRFSIFVARKHTA